MKKKIILSILFILALVGIDQYTKCLAVKYLVGNSINIIDGVFQLTYVENTGAAFGVLKGGIVIFTVITIIVLALIIYAYFKYLRDDKFKALRILSIFIIAGAIGNFIDRIVNGYVVDFMRITFIDFPVFNVADLYVSWSAVIVFILMIFKYKDTDFSHDEH